MPTDLNGVAELLNALKNPQGQSTDALIANVEAVKTKIIEVHQEWMEHPTSAPYKPQKGTKQAKQAKPAKKAPEGVVAAPAAQSPGVAPAIEPALSGPVPKELAIDMVHDIDLTEATGRGQRTRKPHKFFEEVAAPTKGKRKRPATEEEDAHQPSKKRAATRDASVLRAAPAAAAVTPAPSRPVSRGASQSAQPPLDKSKNKRKRADDEDGAVLTTAPATKKRATSRAASTAPPRITRSVSRAASVAASVPSPPGAAASAAGLSEPSAPVPKKRGRPRKDKSAAPAQAKVERAVKAPAPRKKGKGKGRAAEAEQGTKGKGKGRALDPVEEEEEDEELEGRIKEEV